MRHDKVNGKHDVMIQCGDPIQHRSQGILERFNPILADYFRLLLLNA